MHLGPGFALLLGASLTAGCSDDGLASQNTASTAMTSTGAEIASASEAGTSADPAGSTTGPADPDTGSTADTTEATTGSGSGSGTSPATDTTTEPSETETTTGEPNQACADGCAVEFACGMEWASEQECVDWCEANLEKADAFSPFCRAAWENVSACLGTLTCKEFAQWENPTMFPYPCSDDDVVLSVECKGQ